MKLKKLKIFWNKMGSMGCKCSSLNAPGTENPLSHSILKMEYLMGPRSLETKEGVVRSQIQINAKDQDEDFPNDAAVAGVASVSSKVP